MKHHPTNILEWHFSLVTRDWVRLIVLHGSLTVQQVRGWDDLVHKDLPKKTWWFNGDFHADVMNFALNSWKITNMCVCVSVSENWLRPNANILLFQRKPLDFRVLPKKKSGTKAQNERCSNYTKDSIPITSPFPKKNQAVMLQPC